MSTEPAWWHDAEPRLDAEPPRHMIVIVRCDRESLRAAEDAARMAGMSGCALTVVALLEPPWSLAFDPFGAAYFAMDDNEIDLAIHLSRMLDPYGVPWRLQPVTVEPVSAIAKLIEQSPARCVVIVRRRRWHRITRIARALDRRCGLPVLSLGD
jgi:hypothetical protein